MLDVGQMPFAEAAILKLMVTEFYQRMTDTFTQVLGLYGQLTEGSSQPPLGGGLMQQHKSSLGLPFSPVPAKSSATLSPLPGWDGPQASVEYTLLRGPWLKAALTLVAIAAPNGCPGVQ